jgi:hypothetical protein
MFSGKHSDLTQTIIGSFYIVYNQLGYGFSEKVYENALALELQGHGLKVGLLMNFSQKPQHVRKIYDNERKGLLTWTKRAAIP